MPEMRQKRTHTAKSSGRDTTPARQSSASSTHTTFRSEINKTLAELEKKQVQRRKR